MANNKVFRLESQSVKWGENPTDQLLSVHEGVTLASGAVSLQTQFAPGSKVRAFVAREFTVDSAGKIAFNNDISGETDTVTVVVLANCIDQQAAKTS